LKKYTGTNPSDQDAFVILLEQIAEPVSLSGFAPPGICRDPHDEPYIQTALAGRADYLVSGDADLLDLKTVAHIPIITPAVFERILNKTA
jgi:putative PIN family toxin of toxin-antitoxin system